MKKQRSSQDSVDATAFQGMLWNELAAVEMLGNCDLTDGLRFLIGSRLLPQCQRRLGRLAQLTAIAAPQTDT